MDVKGSFFFGRRRFIVEKFGQAKWDEFLEKLSETVPVFRDSILMTSQLPVEAYCQLQEALLQEFFGGNEKIFWEMGEVSADWAMVEGPYRNLLQNAKGVKAFVERTMPVIWSAYFTEGMLKGSCNDDLAEIEISNLPLLPLSFEYVVMGFIKRTVELLGFDVKVTCLKGFLSGDRQIHYQFQLKPH